jgi:hypothetical protein
MSITLTENPSGQVLEVRVTDKLTRAEYQQFASRFEALLKPHEKINVLFEMVNLHGWDFAVMWDDIKFDVKHFSDIRRIAMVGDKKWEKTMSLFAQPFTTAKIRFFDVAAINEARTWLESS